MHACTYKEVCKCVYIYTCTVHDMLMYTPEESINFPRFDLVRLSGESSMKKHL